MATVTFDTLKFADALKSAGVPAAQAEAEARALASAMSEVDVASKRDVDQSEKTIIAKLDAMQQEMKTLELRLTVKLGAFVAGGVALLFALLRSAG